MKKNWYKYLSFILLLYVVAVGLSTPLGPGIAEVSPEQANTGEKVSVKILGYNTHLAEASAKAWLIYQSKKDTINLAAEIDKSAKRDDTHLNLSFTLPGDSAFCNKYFTDNKTLYFSLVINNKTDGTFSKDGAFAISRNTVTYANAIYTDCKPEVTANKGTGFKFPYRYILEESIRNLFFHVPMWFAMFMLFGFSLFYAMRYLYKTNELDDVRSSQFAFAGMIFGLCGLLTGMIWARHTWGQYWVFTDVKLNGAGIITLMYFAYIVLRNSIQDVHTRAKISAVYNLFAAVAIIPLLFVLPNNSDTLHPGNGGNPGFKSYDLDLKMRLVFYPAVLGWMLLGYWIAQIRIRIKKLEIKLHESE